MKTLIAFLISIPLYAQTYVGIYGGYNEGTVGIKSDIRYDFPNSLGAKLNFFYSDHREKDIFSLQASYILNKNSFYTPIIASGVEFNDGTKPLLSLSNLFTIEDYLKLSFGVDTNFREQFYNVGVVIRFRLIEDENFKPRFF